MAVDPILGGALIGGASSALGNLMNQTSSRRQNKRMVDFWKMQNEYNHPSQQMARLKEAGLNPNLIYGDSVSGATGKAEAVGTPDKPEFDNPIEKFQNTRQQVAQTNNLAAINDKLIADAELSRMKSLTELANSQIKGMNKEILAQTINSVVDGIHAKSQSSQMDSITKAQNMISPEESVFMKDTKMAKAAADTDFANLRNKIAKIQLSNEEKRGIMYGLENQLKQKNLDFYESQAIINMVSRILGVIPGLGNMFKQR